jgi:non-ribosomal peptide synthetase component F
MAQDDWPIVASHLAILKAGGIVFLDDAAGRVITHMLNDARPALVLTRGQDQFRDLPTLNVLKLPASMKRGEPPAWLDDPTERLAAIFYTSGTTGMPRGVECPHAGYVNLALSYADYFDLIPGVDATSLISSLGYDGSLSEMYSAWVSGCAVVLLTKDEVRSGPDLLPVLCEAEVTVLFVRRPAHNTHSNTGGRSSISSLPLYRIGGRSFRAPSWSLDSTDGGSSIHAVD